MKRVSPTRWIFALSLLAAGSVGALLAADPPAPPKLSSIVPAADLVAQAKLYLASFDKGLAGEQEYKESASKIERDAHTLTALALALANHDADNELQAAAPAVMAASQALAAAQDYAAAHAALKSLHAAMEGKGEKGGAPKWGCVAPMDQLMKQVVFVNNRLKRGMRRFAKQTEEQARDAAVLAVIAQEFVYDDPGIAESDDLDRWYQLCGQMRDAAGELNAKARAADKAGAEAALAKLAQSCDDCHEVFRVEE
ncbi:MAG TPA: cytochrome c [Pirellulales bacterium]|nr:cytochrome c [Pirellulales bacterium]